METESCEMLTATGMSCLCNGINNSETMIWVFKGWENKEIWKKKERDNASFLIVEKRKYNKERKGIKKKEPCYVRLE